MCRAAGLWVIVGYDRAKCMASSMKSIHGIVSLIGKIHWMSNSSVCTIHLLLGFMVVLRSTQGLTILGFNPPSERAQQRLSCILENCSEHESSRRCSGREGRKKEGRISLCESVNGRFCYSVKKPWLQQLLLLPHLRLFLLLVSSCFVPGLGSLTSLFAPSFARNNEYVCIPVKILV